MRIVCIRCFNCRIQAPTRRAIMRKFLPSSCPKLPNGWRQPACLEFFRTLPANDPFRSLPNVSTTPHIELVTNQAKTTSNS